MSDYLTHHEYTPGPSVDEPVREPSSPEKYRCLACDWFGSGGLAAYDHHRIAHHPIGLTYNPALGPVSFSCCSRKARTS